jgi:hypothetical protein
MVMVILNGEVEHAPYKAATLHARTCAHPQLFPGAELLGSVLTCPVANPTLAGSQTQIPAREIPCP